MCERSIGIGLVFHSSIRDGTGFGALPPDDSVVVHFRPCFHRYRDDVCRRFEKGTWRGFISGTLNSAFPDLREVMPFENIQRDLKIMSAGEDPHPNGAADASTVCLLAVGLQDSAGLHAAVRHH
jgi:hypothetical protein